MLDVIRRLVPAVLALAMVLSGVSDLFAQATGSRAPVALAVEVAGGRIAGVEPFREIASGTTVTVPAGVRFVFQHYGSCRKFTMTGGTAVFRADGVDITGAKASDVKTACPKKLRLKEDGASAAVVMRSVGPPRTAIATQPEFVIVGPRAAEFTALRVRKGSEVILEQSLVQGPRLPWPAGTAALAPGTSYDVELVPAKADAKPLVVSVRTLDAPIADDTLTLVSAE